MATGPLPDRWYSRDFPVLIEVTRRIDEGAGHVSAYDLPAALNMSETEVQTALKALARQGLLDVVASRAASGRGQVVSVRDVAGAAYVMTGLHPGDDDVRALADAFRAAAEATDDPAEATKLRRIADTVKDVSSDVAKRVLAAYLAARIPG